MGGLIFVGLADIDHDRRAGIDPLLGGRHIDHFHLVGHARFLTPWGQGKIMVRASG